MYNGCVYMGILKRIFGLDSDDGLGRPVTETVMVKSRNVFEELAQAATQKGNRDVVTPEMVEAIIQARNSNKRFPLFSGSNGYGGPVWNGATIEDGSGNVITVGLTDDGQKRMRQFGGWNRDESLITDPTSPWSADAMTTLKDEKDAREANKRNPGERRVSQVDLTVKYEEVLAILNANNQDYVKISRGEILEKIRRIAEENEEYQAPPVNYNEFGGDF